LALRDSHPTVMTWLVAKRKLSCECVPKLELGNEERWTGLTGFWI
jgi:hypothetical protein